VKTRVNLFCVKEPGYNKLYSHTFLLENLSTLRTFTYNALILVFATYMLVVLVVTSNQAQFADDRDCNVYSRKICCYP